MKKSINTIKTKISNEERDLIKLKEKFEQKKSKGKLSSTEIEKENIRISKQQIKINKLEGDLDRTKDKLTKMRE